MTSVRLRRLQSDYEAVRRLCHLHPRIEVEGVSGNPPDCYRLVLNVRSLVEKGSDVVRVDRHRLEVRLPLGYPRDAPLCRMLTPVFHPNIAPHAVCVGDHWSAAESLDQLIQRVGEMLAFQSYNVKSPLNGRAARYVEEHLDLLPVDREEFFIDLASEEALTSEPDPELCSNCGSESLKLIRCSSGHRICADCTVRCETCGRLLCLACGIVRCPVCVGVECSNCGAPEVKAQPCARGHSLCRDCALTCRQCGRPLCVLCGEYPCAVCSG